MSSEGRCPAQLTARASASVSSGDDSQRNDPHPFAPANHVDRPPASPMSCVTRPGVPVTSSVYTSVVPGRSVERLQPWLGTENIAGSVSPIGCADLRVYVDGVVDH